MASPAVAWGMAGACTLTAFCSMLTLARWPSSVDRGLQKVAIVVEEMAQQQTAKFSSQLEKIFFIAETPSMVAEFEYVFDHMNQWKKGGNRPEIFLRESQDLSNQFRLWPSYADFSFTDHPGNPLFTEQKGVNYYVGRSALYITPETDALPQSISGAFEKVIPLHTLRIFKHGRVSQELNIYLCRNYQTLPL